MVSSLNSKLCNTLGDLLIRCTSKFINSSQIYPQIDHSIYDSMSTEEWSEVMNNLRKLPDGSFMKCLSLFNCIPWLSSHKWFKPGGGSFSSALYFQIHMPGDFLSRTLAFLLLLSSNDGMIIIYYRVKIIMSFLFLTM